MTLITPEFLRAKRYTALRDRLALEHGGPVQPGVWDAGDFKVTQRGTPSMNVDVAGGYALVDANNATNRGLYHVENDAAVVVPFTAAHATLPRLDQVFLVVNDSNDGGDAGDDPQLLVVDGTPTAGATLDNRTGFGTVPENALRLADVLVPAASTTVTTANIRDRRPWARGFWRKIVRNANAAAGSNYTTASTTLTAIDATNLAPRFECGGSDVRVTIAGGISPSVAATMRFSVDVDGALLDGVTTATGHAVHTQAAAYNAPVVELIVTPSAGSHKLTPVWSTNAGTLTALAAATTPLVVAFEEILRPASADNS